MLYYMNAVLDFEWDEALFILRVKARMEEYAVLTIVSSGRVKKIGLLASVLQGDWFKFSTNIPDSALAY